MAGAARADPGAVRLLNNKETPIDHTQFLHLFDREQRIEIEFPGMRKDVLPRVTRFVRSEPGLSFVLHSRLDEACADAEIDAQVAYFSALGTSFEWKVYTHDSPPDLPERMRAHGFNVMGPDAVMVLDLDAAPEALLRPVPAEVRKLERAEELGAVKEVLSRVWGGDFAWIDSRLGGNMQVPGYLSVYVAEVDGRAGCAGWVYFNPGCQIASLWGGSTVPELRRRGLYTAVLAARVQEARQRGYRYMVIDAGPESKPIVTRHGFELLTEAYDCEWKPATKG